MFRPADLAVSARGPEIRMFISSFSSSLHATVEALVLKSVALAVSSASVRSQGIFLHHYCFLMRVLQAFGLHLTFAFQGCVLVTFGCCGYLLRADH